ncbi:MAG: type II toxin-antitoxin system VapC family toxin [Rhodocyclaceae bacterium]|uniref:type II toxin-antitoxin system VapC family toxin n=1 Tax=Sulfuricystis thermophila TaxID=2496847 RepID=UPI0015598417|nr:type II toxin-antitoxin system VapC family toxin [Sulfuricystis thermophila]MDI6749761.1 type II toxin-antitoxin system VapC family toxin [Rhodocyclaceae bacterium]
MILLDTHIWLDWIIRGPQYLPTAVQNAMAEDELAVSAISCFEVAMLARRKIIELEMPVADWLQQALAPSGVRCISASCEIAALAVELSPIHKDPADRIIIATAVLQDARLASRDSVFPQYPELRHRLIS